MTRLTTTPLAVSADYADALLAARRAKNWLFLLLLLGLLAQIALFLCAKFNVIKIGSTGDTTISMPTKVDASASAPSTGPTTSTAEGGTTTTDSTASAS